MTRFLITRSSIIKDWEPQPIRKAKSISRILTGIRKALVGRIMRMIIVSICVSIRKRQMRGKRG